MGNLTSLLSKTTEFIELGVVKSAEGGQTYMVTIDGVDKKVYSTIDKCIPLNTKVIVSKLSSGKRFITNETGLIGNSSITQEVYIDG